MPKSSNPPAPNQPLCSGCSRFSDGACDLLLRALESDSQAVVTACTHYDPTDTTPTTPPTEA